MEERDGICSIQPNDIKWLEKFILRIFDEREKALTISLEHRDRALALATENTIRENESRGKEIFVLRQDYLEMTKDIKEQLINIKESHAAYQGGMKVAVAVAAIIGGVIGAVVSHLVN